MLHEKPHGLGLPPSSDTMLRKLSHSPQGNSALSYAKDLNHREAHQKAGQFVDWLWIDMN